jgi:hypothetical protein
MCVESCLVQRTEVYAVRILLSVSFGSAAKMFRISQEKKKKNIVEKFQFSKQL